MNETVHVFELIQSIATLFTPFLVVWIGISSINRRNLIRELNLELRGMRAESLVAQKECREDIQALVKQLSEYPRRSEMNDAMRDIRQDFKARNL